MKVVVFGSDRYLERLFPHFNHFYKKFWPDNPWSTQVVSQTAVVSEYPTLSTGPDDNFSDQLLRWVRGEEDEPFIMLLDDYFLSQPVATDVVEHCYDVMLADPTVMHINLWVIGGDKASVRYDDILDEFERGKCRWLLQNQAGMWRPLLIRDLVRPGEDGWQMEIRGSRRARTYPARFLTVRESAVSYYNYMGRAGPRRKAVEWVRKQGLDPIFP